MGTEKSSEEWLKELLEKIPAGWEERRLDQILAEPHKFSKSEENNLIKLMESVKRAEIYGIKVPSHIYNIIGTYYFNKREYSSAADYFKKAISTDSRFYFSYHNYAAVLAYLGQQNRDINVLEESLQVINRTPRNRGYKKGHILYQKAWVLDTMWRIGNKEKFTGAINMYYKSIKLNEKEGDDFVADSARYNIACMQALAEDYEKAKELLLQIKSGDVIKLAKNDDDLSKMRSMPEYTAIFK